MTDLTRIANKCGTDKGTLSGEAHRFTEIYERYFQDFKNLNRPLKILEIGVQFGSSILMLQEYFKYCDVEIYGLDIELSQCSVSFDSNVHLVEGDQNSKETLDKVIEMAGGKFDIIIDDGSHQFEHQYHSLLYLIDAISNDGIYIMEDLHTSLVWGDVNDSPLHFLNFLKKPSFYTEEEYKKVSERIKDVTVFNMYNPRGICNSRSITSVITFKK